MIVTQPRQLNNQTSPSSPFLSLLNFGRQELSYLVRGLASWALAALLLGAVLLLTLAWQAPLDWQVKLGADAADSLYIRSFNQPEKNQAGTFRWSSDESYLRFMGVGRMPAGTLELTMQVGGRPANLGDAHLQVYLGDPNTDGQLLGAVAVGPGLQPYRFNFTAASSYSGDLLFVLREPDAFTAPDHARPLGVVVSNVHLTGGVANNRPVVPAPAYLAVLLASLIVFYLALVRAGWQPIGATRLTVLPMLGAAWAIAFARLQLTPALEVTFLTLLLSYPLLILGLRSASFWLKRRSTALPSMEARWLGLIFVVAFVVKGAGLNHPAFLTIDHWFRVHQILRFVNEPNLFWPQYYNVMTGQTVTGFQGGSAVLGQWGVSVGLPYSPLFYLVAAPLAFIWPTHDPNLLAAVNLLATWLEVSQIWLLYIIARRAYQTAWAGRAGIIAAALFAFLPLSFLLFSDGGYNSILAQWLSLFFMALLIDVLRNPGPFSRGQWVGLGLTLGGALLAHTSTLLLLGTLVLTVTLLLALVREWRKMAWRVAVVGLIGLGLAFGLYYGFYAVNFLTQSLPTLLQNFQNKGALGQEQRLLGTPLLTGFWPQLWQHFRLFPFVLTLCALLILWPFGKSSQWRTNFGLAERERRASVGVYLVWAAWLVVFLLFALVDLKINLLQKHLLFVAPLLCLGSGFGLAMLWGFLKNWSQNRSINPKLLRYSMAALVTALLIFNFWQGVATWYARVYFYVLPPGSG